MEEITEVKNNIENCRVPVRRKKIGGFKNKWDKIQDEIKFKQFEIPN